MDVFTRFVCYRQMLMDKRLQSIEFKLDSLSQGVADLTVICKKVVMPPMLVRLVIDQVGLLPRVESVSASSNISSAVTSALSEGDREKQKLNLIMHNVVESIAEDDQARKRKTLIYLSRHK